jgi:hypothetical protein
MKYENYERLLIEQLMCPELDVRIGELDVSDLNKRRQTARPIVFVLYQGSEFASPEPLRFIAQVETMKFEIVVFARTQRGAQGIYEAFETITHRLLGYRDVSMRTPVIFDRFGYVSEVNGTYQYALQCSFTGYIAERRGAPVCAPS